MRHIITGGSGFTGSVLTKQLLDKGQEVVNIDIRELISSLQTVPG